MYDYTERQQSRNRGNTKKSYQRGSWMTIPGFATNTPR